MLKDILKIYNTFVNENNIKLVKDNEYYSAKIRLGKNCIQVSTNNVDYLKSKINNFICIMSSECKFFSQKNFIENFKTLKIKELTPEEIKKFKKEKSLNFCSSYNDEKNLIVLNQMEYDHIFHEFFHFSSKKNDAVFNEGLYYYIENVGYIGRGINEGYTEILRERYFDIDLKKTGYLYEYQMTQILEKIIGKEIMEYAYFQGNILNIIEELANYCTKEEAKKFIDNMDLMVFLLKKDDEKSKKTRKELLDKNYLFLRKCLLNKEEINKTK